MMSGSGQSRMDICHQDSSLGALIKTYKSISMQGPKKEGGRRPLTQAEASRSKLSLTCWHDLRNYSSARECRCLRDLHGDMSRSARVDLGVRALLGGKWQEEMRGKDKRGLLARSTFGFVFGLIGEVGVDRRVSASAVGGV